MFCYNASLNDRRDMSYDSVLYLQMKQRFSFSPRKAHFIAAPFNLYSAKKICVNHETERGFSM